MESNRDREQVDLNLQVMTTENNLRESTIPSVRGKLREEEGHFKKYWGYYLFIFLEGMLIMCYGLFTEFGKESSPFTYAEENEHTKEDIKQVYPAFQDVHVMIFVGFGFLMTFLKRFSWSAVSINFFLAAWTIQLALLTIGFFKAVLSNSWEERINLTIHKLVDADFAAGSVLIAFGAVIGKLHLFQYLVMATIQTVIYGLQMNLAFDTYTANDMGGSITIHMFGAVFGLTVSLIVRNPNADKHPKNGSNYDSNLFSMIGTLFLWMYWPSFNGALSHGNNQLRCFVNSLLSLTGSCVMVFLLTPFTKKGKLHMEFILNATLAGGVIIGSSADLIVQPWVAFFIGCVSGVVSLLGFEYVGPYLNRKIGLQDTCGVHYLHGIPGFLGGIIATVIIGTSTVDRYGPETLDYLYPKFKDGRTNGEQAGYELATIATSLGLAIFSGIVTGFILKSPHFPKMPSLFEDEDIWEMESEEGDHHNEHFTALHKKNDDYQDDGNERRKGVEMVRVQQETETERT